MPTTVMPSKSKVLTIKGQSYTVNIPKTGQFIDIQALKGSISSDRYNQLIASLDQFTGYARLLTDMIATFNVLIPDLKKNLNIDSMLDLELIEIKEMLDVYVMDWIPFYTNWMDIITSDKKQDDPASKDKIENKTNA